jgi:hypothetical protein
MALRLSTSKCVQTTLQYNLTVNTNNNFLLILPDYPKEDHSFGPIPRTFPQFRPMQTHTFLKEQGQWFIDLPEYIAGGGTKADLQMVEGADTMLDTIAGGKHRVTITLDTTPFNGADELTLLELCDPVVGGGYYLLKSFEGKETMQQMWLCAVTEFVFGYIPSKIFIKKDDLAVPGK